jgi:hypothetical protein
MSTHVTSKVEIKSWNEETAAEAEGDRKLTYARIACAYSGDLEGESTLVYTMSYDGSRAIYLGYEHFSGRIGTRLGSFVLQHTGEWLEGTATTQLEVVPDSGTEQLKSLRGTGKAQATHDTHTFELDYDLK